MKYNFMWSTPRSGAPIVSIASYGITFNSLAIELLGSPPAIKIGYDPEKNVIGVMPITDENDKESFAFAERVRNNYIRVGNKEFVKYIASKTGINIKKGIKFVADWDGEENLLIVDLKKPLAETDDDNTTE